MISKIADKLTSLSSWQLLLIGVLASEVLTLFFSALVSLILWAHIPKEVLVIGIIDAFVVALIIVFFTIRVVKRIRITEITNKQLLMEIKEREFAEAENRKLEKQLRQAQKMEAVGTLAGGIAHDFNNILSAILGYSEIAKMQLPADDKIRKDLDQVIKAGRRATDLVKQILTFSRQGEEKLHPLHVQPIIKEALKLLRSSLPTTIQLTEQINTNCGPILADPTQIHQILMNLCTNAKDAIGEEPGIVSISLSERGILASDTASDCLHLSSGTYLDLEISDTGYGMDSVLQSKIFDPFFTTKEKGKGTGLGLSVVHGIVKQHRGEITVSSEPGHGTTFHIYLPVSREEISVASQNRDKDIPRGKGERILFVDDEHTIATMMQRNLENLGYVVTFFTSSIKALAAFEKNPDAFDLIISDVTMPAMTGVELSRKILRLRPDFPVILCSGFNKTMNETMHNSLGIREYLMKPVGRYTLAKSIREALHSS